MRRIRQHLSFANVVSVIALFIALGGSAAAAVIITDNSQVAQNTISGHKPPSGKHSNIIAGSINGQDVFDNSLGGRVIAEPTLTGNTRKLIGNPGFSDPAKIGTVGPYTIKATCSDYPSAVRAGLYVYGPAGTTDYMFITRANDSGPGDSNSTQNFRSGGGQMPASQDTQILEIQADHGPNPPYGFLARAAGTVMIKSGSVLVQLDIHMVADSRYVNGLGRCTVYGTGVNAT